MQNKIKKLEKILKIKFNNSELLIHAITHKSYNSLKNYEIYEFLGDRVLGLVISKKLIELYPFEKVGILDKKFASLVNKNICYEVGKKLKLDRFVLLGNSNKKINEIEKNIISDSCESLIGAIYVDKGYDLVKKFILHKWNDYLNLSNETIVDSKTKLQEYSLQRYKILPVYKTISFSGPKHKPVFKVGVKITNTKFIYSNGTSKKNAEQSAAKKLLKNLKIV